MSVSKRCSDSTNSIYYYILKRILAFILIHFKNLDWKSLNMKMLSLYLYAYVCNCLDILWKSWILAGSSYWVNLALRCTLQCIISRGLVYGLSEVTIKTLSYVALEQENIFFSVIFFLSPCMGLNKSVYANKSKS